jgi:hypothetical protein
LPRAFGAVLFDQEFAALPGTVGVTGEGEDLGVVHQPIDHGCGDDVGEDPSTRTPAAEAGRSPGAAEATRVAALWHD